MTYIVELGVDVPVETGTRRDLVLEAGPFETAESAEDYARSVVGRLPLNLLSDDRPRVHVESMTDSYDALRRPVAGWSVADYDESDGVTLGYVAEG